ncbi:MAG: ComF family protein [Desulfobacterales bacterium]
MGNSTTIFEMLLAPFLCPACLTGFLPVESPMCSRCGVVFKSREGEDHVCGECLDSPMRFGIARSPGIYEQTLMAAIHCFKYRGKIQLARPFGMLLFTAFISFWEKNSVDLIIPVPLHVKKFRMRGFNPSFLLVRDWATIAAMLNDELPDIPVARDVLERRTWTEPQTGLGRKKRLENVKNAFSINDHSKIAGKRVLLVDDVFTTGATANECAKVLLNGGVGHVDVLTLARAM